MSRHTPALLSLALPSLLLFSLCTPSLAQIKPSHPTLPPLPAQPAAPDLAPPPARPATILRHYFEPGSTTFFRLTQSSDYLIRQEKFQQPGSDRSILDLKLETISFDHTGEGRFRLTFTHLKYDAKQGGVTIAFDSRAKPASATPKPNDPAQPAPTEESTPLSRAYKAVVGKSVEFVMNDRGVVSSVIGADRLVVDAAAGDQNLVPALRQIVGPDALKAMLENAFRFIPEDEVTSAQPWSTYFTAPLLPGYELQVRRAFNLNTELSQDDKDIPGLLITFSTDFAVDKAQTAPSAPKPKQSVKLNSSTGRGKIHFEAADRRLTSSMWTSTLDFTVIDDKQNTVFSQRLTSESRLLRLQEEPKAWPAEPAKVPDSSRPKLRP